MLLPQFRSPFGAQPSPSPFGAATAQSTPAFGAAAGQSTPVFGSTAQPQATPGPFSFPSQQPAASSPFGTAGATPSVFGGANQTPPPAFATPGGFTGFGAPSATPAASAAPAATPFGGFTFPSATPAVTTASPFGAALAAPAAATAATAAPGTAAGPATAAPAGDPAGKELDQLLNAYNPSSPTYKFQHLFFNIVEDPAQRVKPANVDELRWRQALKEAGGPDNRDR